MPSRKKPTSAARAASLSGEAASALARELLGHLNFSNGREDAAFLAALNRTKQIVSCRNFKMHGTQCQHRGHHSESSRSHV